MSSFTTPPLVYVLDRYQFQLAEPFRYYLGELDSNEWIVVPDGFVTDFASVPRFLWWWLPPNGKWAKAALTHDALYAGLNVFVPIGGYPPTRKQADQIFLESMLVLGVPRLKAKLMFWAVRLFGRKAWRGA